MSLYNNTAYQRRQIKVVEDIESQVRSNDLKFSTVLPVEDYENDPRLCLTSVHFPKTDLIDSVLNTIVKPLKRITPSHFYYQKDNLHLTIKNIRVISDPPNFTVNDLIRAKNVFESVVPKYKRFEVYFYRLLLFKSNLALVGTTGEELDEIILDLDKNLSAAGIPDDKQYTNSKNFFCNMTLVRFNSQLTARYKLKIKELSSKINIKPYIIDSVTLLTSNAVLKKRKILGEWGLR